MMNLLVDGIIFQKDPQGGIARLYREIWPRMCDLEPDLQIKLFLDGPGQLNLGSHDRITVQKIPTVRRSIKVDGILKPILFPARRLASRSWNFMRSIWFGQGKGMIWHSTYYSFPEIWRGYQVVTVHDMIHELFPDIFNSPLDDVARKNKHLCVEQADAIICVSDVTRIDMEKYYGVVSKPIYVIPSALSSVFHQLVEPGSQTKVLPREPFLLFVGKRTHHKNFMGFMDAYRVWKENSEIDVVVVGEPWDRIEKSYLQEHRLIDQVTLLNDVDDEGLCLLYNRASAFVFPTLYEGLGLPVLEAMACGCPVVASRIPTTEMTGKDVPFYFNPMQPESITSALDEVINQGRSSARIQRGIALAKRYTWDSTARGYLNVYRNL